MSYSESAERDFIPTNLKTGAALKIWLTTQQLDVHSRCEQTARTTPIYDRESGTSIERLRPQSGYRHDSKLLRRAGRGQFQPGRHVQRRAAFSGKNCGNSTSVAVSNTCSTMPSHFEPVSSMSITPKERVNSLPRRRHLHHLHGGFELPDFDASTESAGEHPSLYAAVAVLDLAQSTEVEG